MHHVTLLLNKISNHWQIMKHKRNKTQDMVLLENHPFQGGNSNSTSDQAVVDYFPGTAHLVRYYSLHNIESIIFI